RILFGQIPSNPEQCVTVSSKLSGTNWIYTTQPKDGWQYFSQIFIILVFSGIFFSLGTARYVFQVVSSGIILAKSEGKFKTIFFDSADANLIIFQNRFIDCNNVTLSLLNAQREQILGKTPWDISPEIQPDGENSALKGARLLKQTIPDGGKKFEWVHERPDGTMLQVEVVLTAITIEDREVLFTTWRDIGERKKAEQELRTMNERLSLISQVSNSIISAEPLANQVQRYSDLIKVVFKIDICIIRVISGNELILLTSTGIEPAKVAGSMKIGFGLSGFLMEEKRALCINDMETHPLTSDYTYLIAGLYKGKSYAGAPILIKGEAIGVLGIYHIHEKREFRDVDLEHLQIIANNIAIVIENQGLYYNLESQNIKLEDELIERRRIEAELKAEKEKAEELHKVKSYFFSNMSHELRTPLQAILGYSQVIQQISVDETQCRMAGVIYQSGQRLSNTVKLILEISRLEADKIKPNVAAVDARSLVQEAFLINKPIASKKNLEMQITTCENEALISVDNSLFVEILNLIIDNAIKFTPEGGIFVSVIKEPEYVHISIKDSGIGISDSKMNVIFDEFRQESEGMGRSYEGTGLGLTLAKKYIELMDGVIKVESKLGEGTIFSIYFPLS
ncbi:MAG: GAF domain-containing protein, partial [Ignavibacteriales bacterium]|nr:GAF domain-containing protein [Ignavibacteriales bacterium]